MAAVKKEIEAKFKVENFDRVRKMLRRCKARPLSSVLETDRFFDTPADQFRKADSTVRLRNFRVLRGPRSLDVRPMLTFKGPAGKRTKLKIRPESQTRLDDADALLEILERLNLRQKLTLQKIRHSYQLGPCRVELDELPLLGAFVEIEGPDARTVLQVAKKLELSGPSLKTSYTRLLTERCKELGRPTDRILFGRLPKGR